MPASWFRIALFNLFLASLLGVLMRYAFVQEVKGLQYMNVMYAHSHVALMGWGFLALIALLSQTFIPFRSQKTQLLKYVFWALQLAVFGMLIAFPIQGYGTVSILFSSLVLLLSYIFIWKIYRELRKNQRIPATVKLFVVAALFFYLLSTIAIWAMGPIILLGYKHEPIYYMAIQFFLHFQINGWIIFAILGLVLNTILNHGIRISSQMWIRVFWLMVLGTLFTYALAVTWSNPSDWIFMINSIGVTIQLVATVLLYIQLVKIRKAIKSKLHNTVYWLIGVAFICFALKVLIQTAVIIPEVAVVAYTIRNFVIGFIHLILLGVFSHFLLAEAMRREILPIKKSTAKLGLILFVSGFVLTEMLLFMQGTLFWLQWGFLPNYHLVLFVVSLLLPLGILGILLSRHLPDFR